MKSERIAVWETYQLLRKLPDSSVKRISDFAVLEAKRLAEEIREKVEEFETLLDKGARGK